MEKKVSYGWLIVVILFVALAGCGENARQNSAPGEQGNTQATTQGTAVSKSNHVNTLPDTVSRISPTADSAFMHSWELFVQAVKQQDTQQLKKLVVFPLMGAGACYLPHDRMQEPQQDTTGITERQFDSLYREIFDRHAVKRITAPLPENDPILVWQDTGMVSRLIAKDSDPGTQIYGYHIEYVKNNREGGSYFLFACFRGRYKLAAVLCDGILLH